MPEGMRDRIAAAAKANGRSMNAEVVALLAAGLDTTAIDLDSVPSGDLLKAVVARYGMQVQIIITPDIAAEVGIKPKRTRAVAK